MSESTNNQTASSNTPSHIAYHVRNRKNAASIWTPIGAAWVNKNGNGFNLQIETVPLDGRITLLIPSAKTE
jgi:hypothetical protein